MNNGIFTWKDEKVELTIINGVITKKTVVDEGSSELKNFIAKKISIQRPVFSGR
jgi:hypothetical protein